MNPAAQVTHEITVERRNEVHPDTLEVNVMIRRSSKVWLFVVACVVGLVLNEVHREISDTYYYYGYYGKYYKHYNGAEAKN